QIGNLDQKGNLESDPEKFLHACGHGDMNTVRDMLEVNAKLLNSKDNKNRSGFALALLAGHKDIGLFLREKGYKPDLHESALALDWDLYTELIGEESAQTSELVNADHPIGGTVMWAAATGGAGSSIWRVYSYCGDPNINTRGKKGTSPLQQALRYPNLKTAEITAASILSTNTDPNPDPNSDIPPPHMAIERGSLEMVEMLIRRRADVNSVNEYGSNPIELAEYYGHASISTMLKNH